MKVREIAEFVGGVVHGDGTREIHSVASLSSAGGGQLAFSENSERLPFCTASCLMVPENLPEAEINNANLDLIKVKNPKLAFAIAATALHPQKHRETFLDPTSIIAPDARIGAGVYIGAHVTVGSGSAIEDGCRIESGAKIGDGVSIGERSIIHPNVVIEDACSIGSNVVLHAGVVIGADGFGYVRSDGGEYRKFPQIGTVRIDDDVEIGANSCVDRGALGETRIGRGTKIDNLVQVAHNVSIGANCVIAAHTGISGSVVIEDDCVIGGQVGIADHVRIKKGAVIGARSAIFPGKIVGPGVWAGTPVQPLDEYKRQNARIKGLDRLRAEVKRLAEKLNSKETPDDVP